MLKREEHLCQREEFAYTHLHSSPTWDQPFYLFWLHFFNHKINITWATTVDPRHSWISILMVLTILEWPWKYIHTLSFVILCQQWLNCHSQVRGPRVTFQALNSRLMIFWFSQVSGEYNCCPFTYRKSSLWCY